ncbi:MAG: hypothetical protein JEZ12_16045 [Desulfobacterium sp.]|nr:hypothetical protein [Desulfobacterium sp.]
MASTKGGEYKGPCPWCGGDDRFSIHPSSDHYVCRRCKKAGDSLQFLMDYENLSYINACIQLDRTPEFKATNVRSKILKEDIWTPRDITTPNQTWQTKAEAIAFRAFKHLMSPQGKIHRDYLLERGLSLSTIKTARIGYNSTSLSFDRASWGLLPEQTKTGQEKSIWIPEGFIIPFFQNNHLVRIRVRQADPDASQRYILVAGSSTEYMSYPAHPEEIPFPKNVVFLVEAELDGWLSWEKFGDLSDVYAVGNTTTRPDTQTHEKLSEKRIMLCLDNDDAGADETAWWKKQYGADAVTTHPVPIGKDPGEAYQHGVDLREWFQGIESPGADDQEPVDVADDEPFVSAPDPVPTIDPVPVQKDPEPMARPEPTNKICLHGHHCISAKDGVCLITKQHLIDLDECPKGQWYFYYQKTGTGTVRQIIYGFNFKK